MGSIQGGYCTDRPRTLCVQLQGWRNHELRLKRLEPEMNFQESNGVQSSSLNLTLQNTTKEWRGLNSRFNQATLSFAGSSNWRGPLQVQSSHPELCGQQQQEKTQLMLSKPRKEEEPSYTVVATPPQICALVAKTTLSCVDPGYPVKRKTVLVVPPPRFFSGRNDQIDSYLG